MSQAAGVWDSHSNYLTAQQQDAVDFFLPQPDQCKIREPKYTSSTLYQTTFVGIQNMCSERYIK